MIAALFIDPKGAYAGIQGLDLWPLERDARGYEGPHRVVAHPPCSRWCQLAHLNQKRYGHKVGDDGGCFESALRSVRRYGGVLEHPAFSHAWKRFGLPRPVQGCWILSSAVIESWVCEVSQAAYGHRARKRTWLYYVGRKPKDLRWATPEPTAMCSYLTNHGGRKLPRLTKKEASATPMQFAKALVSLARAA